MLVIIIFLVSLAVIRNKPEKKEEQNTFEISCLGEKYSINEDKCIGFSKEQVQDFVNKITAATHNVEKTFKQESDLTTKDLQLTVWFQKYKIEGNKACTSKDFEDTIKSIYNISFNLHGFLENTLDYSDNTYKFKDIKYKDFQVPVIDHIEQNGTNTYKVIYTLTNPAGYHKKQVKYVATFNKQNNNFYIKTITEYSLQG